jgi:hypothetical protein
VNSSATYSVVASVILISQLQRRIMGCPVNSTIEDVDGLLKLRVPDELGDALADVQRLVDGQRCRHRPGSRRRGAGARCRGERAQERPARIAVI